MVGRLPPSSTWKVVNDRTSLHDSQILRLSPVERVVNLGGVAGGAA
jgi:hypothetical protein